MVRSKPALLGPVLVQPMRLVELESGTGMVIDDDAVGGAL